MPKINDVYTIIVPANTPVFSAHTYSEVYGGGSGCTATINGVSVTIAAGSTLTVLVRTISGGTGCFLLGENNNVYQGSTGLGGIY
jgi:hypothetical protein